jgi:gamma-glutamylputrescine oxidase
MIYDYVVVGAGFVGLSTAYWLSELAPEAKILVIDKSGLGAGASGRNAGFLTKGSAFFYQHLIQRWGEEKALKIFKFSETSLDLLFKHIISASSLDYVATSSLTLFRGASPNLPQNFGFEKTTSPFFDHFSGALRSPGEFKVRPQELLETIDKLLRQRNVSFNLNSNELLPQSKEKTIFCLNAYTSSVFPEYSKRIEPRRAQMLRVRVPSDTNLGEELYYDPAERVYFRREGLDHLLIGGKRLVDSQNEETNVEGHSVLIQEALEEYLSTLQLKFEVIDRWSGIMGFTKDELPIVENLGNELIVGGFSGHGMGLGFHAGKAAAEISLGNKIQLPF